MPPRKQHTETFLFKLPADLKRHLVDQAKEEQTTAAEILRRALKRELDLVAE